MDVNTNPELLELVQKELEKVDLTRENTGIKEKEIQQDSANSTSGAGDAGAGTGGPSPSLSSQKSIETDLHPSSVLKDNSSSPSSSRLGAGAAVPVKKDKLATVLIMVGMAGAGKSSWTQRFNAHLLAEKKSVYIVNLDPGSRRLPYPANIDICDMVNWRDLMKHYKLGPNGAMITALNLFSLQFSGFLDILEKRAKEYDYILIDTPGQMECFVWSASGLIITQGLAAKFPTTLVYLMDLSRCSSPVTFSHTMLNALTILYKHQLPLIVAMNKIDVDRELSLRVTEWIQDYSAFQEDLNALPDISYACTVASSFALSLDQFYQAVRLVHVSARDGFGLPDFMAAIDKALDEYHNVYVPSLEKMQAQKKKTTEERQAGNLAKLRKDMQEDNLQSTSAGDLFSMPGSYEAIHGLDPLSKNKDDSSSEEE